MPDDHKKSANVRPIRVPVEDKKKHQKEAIKRWQQKVYVYGVVGSEAAVVGCLDVTMG